MIHSRVASRFEIPCAAILLASCTSDLSNKIEVSPTTLTGDLVVSSPLLLSTRTPTTGETVTASVTYTNRGTAPVSVVNMVIALRRPGATHLAGPLDDFAPDRGAATALPGATISVNSLRTFTESDPAGTWYSYATWLDTDGTWHDDATEVPLTLSPHAPRATEDPPLVRLLPPPLGPATCAYQPRTTLMADCAADMVGINTHMNYLGTRYDTRFDDIVEPRLIELGVRHFRDAPGDYAPVTASRFISLARHGIRLLLINPDASTKDYAKGLNATAGLPVVEAVEPPNELDSDFPRLESFVPQMWAAYRGDPEVAEMTILGPSFGNTRDSASNLAKVFSTAGQYMDRGNLHDYCARDPEGALGGGWGLSLDEVIARYDSLSGSRAPWVTENGYKDTGTLPYHPAVTERASSKYLPRQFLAHLMRGVERYYVYQLMNDAEDFAILNNDGSRRAQYFAIKTFIAMLADAGPPFVPQKLDYTLTGDLTNVYSMVFQKRDGRFYLAVWLGVLSGVMAESDRLVADIESPPRVLTLGLRTPIVQANLYTPSFSSLAVEQHADPKGIKSLPLSVPDHVLIVELTP